VVLRRTGRDRRRLHRRPDPTLLRYGAGILAALQLFTGLPGSANAQNTDPETYATKTPIKHVILIIGEPRTFDHIFATYKPKDSETMTEPPPSQEAGGSTSQWQVFDAYKALQERSRAAEDQAKARSAVSKRGAGGNPEDVPPAGQAAEVHIALAEEAELLVIVPATANTLAKLAHGIADNMLTAVALATKAPLLLAPAMYKGMYEHAATKANLTILRERGAYIIEPEVGRLASGAIGVGRLPELPVLMGAISMIFG